jgi:enoyl-CoA hydratase/carnithine racemase
MHAFETIRYRVDAPIARVALNRPDKLNAVNNAMVAELNVALELAERDGAVRTLLLSGEGRAFSAGFDLNAGADVPPEDVAFWRAELRRDFDLVMRFWDFPKPVVAAVHGFCLGSAMEIAIACDVTVAARDCRFGAPEVKFGSGIVALLLPWIVGPKAAKELLLMGADRVSAGRALELGLVNRVVAEGELHAEAERVARAIACNDLLAVRRTKAAVHRTLEIMGFREALLEALELDVQIETTRTAESRAFNEVLRRDGLRAALEWRVRTCGG